MCAPGRSETRFDLDDLGWLHLGPKPGHLPVAALPAPVSPGCCSSPNWPRRHSVTHQIHSLTITSTIQVLEWLFPQYRVRSVCRHIKSRLASSLKPVDPSALNWCSPYPCLPVFHINSAGERQRRGDKGVTPVCPGAVEIFLQSSPSSSVAAPSPHSPRFSTDVLNSAKPLGLEEPVLAMDGEWWKEVLLWRRMVGSRDTKDALCLKLEETRLEMRSTQGRPERGQFATTTTTSNAMRGRGEAAAGQCGRGSSAAERRISVSGISARRQAERSILGDDLTAAGSNT